LLGESFCETPDASDAEVAPDFATGSVFLGKLRLPTSCGIPLNFAIAKRVKGDSVSMYVESRREASIVSGRKSSIWTIVSYLSTSRLTVAVFVGCSDVEILLQDGAVKA
jgi:hypothetical protein